MTHDSDTEINLDSGELKIYYDDSVRSLPYEVRIDNGLLQDFLKSEGFSEQDVENLHLEIKTGIALAGVSGQYHPLKNRILLNPGSHKINSSPDKPLALTTTILHEIGHAKEHLHQGEHKKLEPQTMLYYSLGISALIAASGLYAKEVAKQQGHKASATILASGLGLAQLAYRMAPYEKRARGYAEHQLGEHPDLMGLVTVKNK